MPNQFSGRRGAENDTGQAPCQRGQEHADFHCQPHGFSDGIGEDHDSQDDSDLRRHGDELPVILSLEKKDVKKRGRTRGEKKKGVEFCPDLE
jgi:hypothetical protein